MTIWYFLVWMVMNSGQTIVAAPSFTSQEECNQAVMDQTFVFSHLQIPKDQIKALNQWTDYCESSKIDLSKDAVI